MEDRERVLQENDAEHTQNALSDDGGHRDESQTPQPAAFTPERPRQGQGEQPDERPHQPMAVLAKDAAHHPRPGEENHVVAERARPVGHRQRGARVRDQSPKEDKDTRGGQGGERSGRQAEVKTDRVVNLSYYINSDLPPRVAFKLNILGLEN